MYQLWFSSGTISGLAAPAARQSTGSAVAAQDNVSPQGSALFDVVSRFATNACSLARYSSPSARVQGTATDERARENERPGWAEGSRRRPMANFSRRE